MNTHPGRITIISLFFRGLFFSSPILAANSPPPSGMEKALETVQLQIRQVQASIPKMVRLQANATAQQLVALQKQMQAQIVVLHNQIQQVETQTNKEIMQLQKEIRARAAIK